MEWQTDSELAMKKVMKKVMTTDWQMELRMARHLAPPMVLKMVQKSEPLCHKLHQVTRSDWAS